MKEKENAPLLLTLSSKKCACCGEIKPTTGFYRKNNRGKWGFCSHCKECKNKKVKEYRLENPEKIKENALKRNYGITLEYAEKMLKNQNYKCAICGEELFLVGSSKKLKAHVDHDHKTDKVRGLLCDNCNKGLGHFRDNTDYLLSAVSYLNKNT